MHVWNEHRGGAHAMRHRLLRQLARLPVDSKTGAKRARRASGFWISKKQIQNGSGPGSKIPILSETMCAKFFIFWNSLGKLFGPSLGLPW
jgi:hypothetical protein